VLIASVCVCVIEGSRKRADNNADWDARWFWMIARVAKVCVVLMINVCVLSQFACVQARAGLVDWASHAPFLFTVALRAANITLAVRDVCARACMRDVTLHPSQGASGAVPALARRRVPLELGAMRPKSALRRFGGGEEAREVDVCVSMVLW
jgi:hypothetical protein